MEYKVYILRTIDDTTPRYVGITTGKLNTRLVKHIHDIKRKSCKNAHKKNWLAKNKETASVYLKVQRVRIIDVCKGRRIHTGGYKFRYKIQ